MLKIIFVNISINELYYKIVFFIISILHTKFICNINNNYSGSNERDYDLQPDDINGSSDENEENIAKYEI